MRYFKWITSGLMLGLVGLFIYQNSEILRTPVPFSLNLYIHESAQWSHSLYVLILAFLLVGFGVGILVMLKPFLSSRRQLARERHERAQMTETCPQPVAPPAAALEKESSPQQEPPQSPPAQDTEKPDSP